MTERTPMRPRGAYRHFSAIQTRWLDNDIYGHVNNTVYYSWFDTAVNAYLINAGVLDIAGGATIGLVVETGCRYARAVAFPEAIEAGVRVARLGTSSVRYEIGLFTADQDAPAAEGFFIHVYVDRASRRPVAVDAAFRAALEAIAG
jgi:acyl-CoA thioester hydrolase